MRRSLKIINYKLNVSTAQSLLQQLTLKEAIILLVGERSINNTSVIFLHRG